jgi:hypothetical protein
MNFTTVDSTSHRLKYVKQISSVLDMFEFNCQYSSNNTILLLFANYLHCIWYYNNLDMIENMWKNVEKHKQL